MDSVYALLMKSQLRWSGHVARMPDERIPKQIFFGELCNGTRHQGRPLLRYKDTLKANLKKSNINPDAWETIAQNRPVWRSHSRSGTIAYEEERKENAATKRQNRKQRQKDPPTVTSDLTHYCSVCSRGFRAQIGLISHMKHKHTK